MFPDTQDVKNATKKLTGCVSRPTPENIWESVAIVREFIAQARDACWGHGRHRFILASDLKKEAESFLQRPVSAYEFCAALLLAAPAPTTLPHGLIDVAKFEGLKVKFPPLGRIGEYREGWARVQAEIEHEIACERERVALINQQRGMA